MRIKSVCVYCGSSSGIRPEYSGAARELAQELVLKKIALVYGGGNVGLMGIIADEVLRLGGEAIGVIPEALMDREVGHRALTHLYIVKDMHERKARMAELCDAFVALPGGIGTLEELFETLTWSQLGFHDKPIGLLNVCGFYDGLVQFIQHLVAQGFLRAEHAALLLHQEHASKLLQLFESFQPQPQNKLLVRRAAERLLR